MEFKQKGESIRGKYQVLSAFPFVEGVLYFTALTDPDQADSSAPSTRFIHALKLKKQSSELEVKELLHRHEDIFFPVEDVFVDEGILYQVFEKMEGNLLGIYLLQSAPLPLAAAADILKKITNHLMNCYDRGQFTLVDPQNIVITKAGQIRFLYGGPKKLLSYEHPEAEDVKKVGSLLYTMLTKKHADEQTGQIEPLRQERQDVPLELEGLLMRSLSPDPLKRPRVQDFWRWAIRYEEKKPAALIQEAKSAPVSSTSATAQSVVKPKWALRKEKHTASKSGPKRRVRVALVAVAALALIYVISQFFSDPVDPALEGILDPSVEQDEEQAVQFFEESNQAYEQNKLNEAIALARKAVSADPMQTKYFQNLANLYGVARDYQKGKQTLEAAVKKFPREAKLYDALAVYAFYLNDLQTAREAADKAVQLNGEESLYFYHQGKVYGALKKYDKAVQSLRYCTMLSGNNGRYLHDLAIYLYRSGKLDDAINTAKKAVYYANHEKEKYYVTLGILYLKKVELVYNDKGLNPEQKKKEIGKWAKRAYGALNKAVELKEDYAEGQYYKAVAHYYDGNYKTAVSAAEKAVKLNPKNAVYHYQLGLAYMMEQDREKAISAFKKAVELNPKSFLYKKALARVQVSDK